MTRIGLVCMVFLGCSSPSGFIDSYRPSQFAEPSELDESSELIADLFKMSTQAARSIKPGMSIDSVDKILRENGFYLLDRKDTPSEWDREYRHVIIVHGPTRMRMFVRIKNELDVVKQCEITSRPEIQGVWVGEESHFESDK